MEQYKTCNRCKQILAICDFSKRVSSKDGLHSTCKVCINSRARESYKRNPASALENSKRFYSRNKIKRLDQIKLWQVKNQAQIKAKASDWESNNKQRRSIQRLNWQQSNAEKVKQYSKNWAKNNQQKVNLKTQRRRARFLKSDIRIISKKDSMRLNNSLCFYCNQKATSLDHVIPLSRGGRHSIGNLVSCCKTCNSSKNEKTVMEWRIFQNKKGQKC